MLSLRKIIGPIFAITASMGVANAASVASISGDGLYASNDSGLFVYGEFGGQLDGLVIGDLPSYHYSAFVWECGIIDDYEGDGFPGCPVSEEPTLGGTISGGELFSLFGDPEPEVFVDTIAGFVEGLSFDGAPNYIDLGFLEGILSIRVEDGFVGENSFFALASIYFGDDASCADFFGSSSETAGCIFPEGPDGAFSLRMSIDDEVSAVPLPAGLPLLVVGLGALGLAGRRRKECPRGQP